MPPLEYLDLTELAVLWAFVGTNREGEATVASPVQIPVRWEEEQKEIVDKAGTRWEVQVTLATNQNLALNSILWEGALATLQESYPLQNGQPVIVPPSTDIYEAVTRVRARDLRGRYTRYEFGLRRYKDTVPKVIATPVV